MPNLGPTELIIILIIVIAIFGAGKLASLGGALGKGVRDFRAAVREGQNDKAEEGASETAKATTLASSISTEATQEKGKQEASQGTQG